MSSASPEPFVPPDADCRQLDGFMLNVERLLSSELWALSSGDEMKAALGLWCRAWKQIPAGSLPNNEKVLATFSGAGKRWPKVRSMALHGFVLCSDGRLYHPVLCEDVCRAIQRQDEFQKKRERDAERLRKWREKQSQNADETGDETRFETAMSPRYRTGQGQDRDVREESKITPLVQRSETPARALRAPATYAFAGAIIRLTQADFERWKSSFSAIPDLMAELETIDAKLVDEGFDGKWFGRVSAWLRTRHEELLRRRNGEDEAYRGLL